MGKRTKEGCDRSIKVGTSNSGQDGEEAAPLRKPKESVRRESVRKVSSPDSRAGMPSFCNDRG